MPGLTFIWSARMRFLCWRVYLSLRRVSTVSSQPLSEWCVACFTCASNDARCWDAQRFGLNPVSSS